MNQQIEHLIKSIELGEPKNHNNMVAFSLFSPVKNKLDYLTLGEAISRKLAEVTEVSEQGSVPTLAVINHSDQPILIIDGEELAGAKQNRIVNTTLLLDAKSKTLIPVSCTEQGRWNFQSKEFSHAGHVMSSAMRARKNLRVQENLYMKMAYDADQRKVWNDVSNFIAETGTHSSSSAMKDSFDQRKDDINGYVKSFQPEKDQRGVLVFINGKPVGFDFISRGEAYEKLHEKLMKSYAADAMINPKKTEEQDYQIEGYKFIHSLLECEESVFKPTGMGHDFRYKGEHIIGAALKMDDEVVHLNAARLNGKPSGNPDKDFFDFINSRRRNYNPVANAENSTGFVF